MNRINLIIVSALLVSVLVGCTSDKKDVETGMVATGASDTVPTLPVAGSVSGDTINLHGKFIVFYANQDTSNDLTIKAFNETASIIVDSLKKAADLPVAVTSVNNFRVYNRTGSPMILSRQGFSEKVGVLVMDGLQPPSIRKGAITTEECHALIKKYFMKP